MTRIWFRSFIKIFVLNTHRPELLVKNHFRVTIGKFVVTFVLLKCHLSHILEIKLKWQPCLTNF